MCSLLDGGLRHAADPIQTGDVGFYGNCDDNSEISPSGNILEIAADARELRNKYMNSTRIRHVLSMAASSALVLLAGTTTRAQSYPSAVLADTPNCYYRFSERMWRLRCFRR